MNNMNLKEYYDYLYSGRVTYRYNNRTEMVEEYINISDKDNCISNFELPPDSFIVNVLCWIARSMAQDMFIC